MGSVVFDSAALRLGIGPSYGTISTVADERGVAQGASYDSTATPRGQPGVGSWSQDGGQFVATTPPPSTVIPFPRDRAFVDRPDLLARIDEFCSSPGGRAALVGIDGIGKSQLAIEHAYRTREAASSSTTGGSWVSWILDDAEPDDAAKSVFCIQAGTLLSVEEGFRAIAEAVGILDRNSPGVDVIPLVCSWLSEEHGQTRWLIVLDGAESADVFFGDSIGSSNTALADLLPHTPRGSFLFTTSDRGLALRLTSLPQAVIEVGPMELEEAILLFERKMGTPYGRLGVKADLVEELELIPLAITQAATYIHDQPDMAPEIYLQKLRENNDTKATLLGTGGGDGRRDAANGCSALETWQAKVLRIHAARPSAADLLCRMSFFDHRDMPCKTLRLFGEDDAAGGGDVSNPSSSINDDLTLLHDLCLITNSTHGGVKMLQLVQLSIKTWLVQNGQLERFYTEFITRLNKAFPEPGGGSDDSILSWRLIPHADRAAARKPSGEKTQLSWASLLHKSALCQLKQGRFYGAEQHAALSAHQLIISQGVAHHDALAAKKTLLEALEHLQPQPGLLPLAIDTATSILGGRHGTQDLQRYQSTVDIATIHLEQGQPKQAEALCKAERAILKHRLGDDHLGTLKVTVTLASVYIAMERLIEAENLLTRALDTYQRTLEKDDAATLACTEELATARARQGKLHKAEASFLHVIEARKRVSGMHHRTTLTSMRRMASEILWAGGYEAEAQDMLTRVLGLHEEALGEEDDDTATCMYDLAGVLMARGRCGEPEELLRKVIATRKKGRGAGHLMTLTSMSDLAGIYKSQRRWEEAEVLLPEVIEGKKQLLGEEHGDTISDMRVLAEVYMAQSRWGEAEVLLAKVIDGQTELLGANHEDTMASEEMFYEVMRQQGRLEESTDCKSDIRAGS